MTRGENNNTTTLLAGLNLDVDPEKLASNEYTFALNAVDGDIDGGGTTIHNERGSEECFKLKENYVEIGSIRLADDETVIFSTDGQNSEIGLVDCECNYTELYSASCLNFNKCNRITGEFKIRRGCERVIYFRDGVNSDKRINIDELLEEDCKEFTCNDFTLTPKVKIPCLKVNEILDYGGNMPSGMYFFQIEIFDRNTNSVYKTGYSNGIAIYADGINDSYNSINGNYNEEQFLSDIGGEPNSNKSISFTICDLDESFAYFKVNVIRYITGDGYTRDAHTTGLLTIVNDEMEYTYSGFNASNGDSLVDVDETLIPNVRYSVSNAMEQVQNRLVRIGVKEDIKDYSKYQRYASKICTKYVVNKIDKDSNVSGNAKNPLTYFDNMSFASDEVYALGIVYINDDCTESPVFHIPGRGKNISPECVVLNPGYLANDPVMGYEFVIVSNQIGSPDTPCETTYTLVYTLGTDPTEITITGDITITQEVVVSSTQEIHIVSFDAETPPNAMPCDYDYFVRQVITSGGDVDTNSSTTIGNPTIPNPQDVDNWDCEIIPAEDVNNYLNEDSERWEIYNTAYAIDEESGYMAYYQCKNEASTYLQPDSCCIENYWGVDCCGNILENTPIRHHKFPDRRLVCAEDDDDNLNQLGVEFSNIEYPDGVIGHYFVKAKRDSQNRTVIDQGVLGNMKLGESELNEDIIGFTYFAQNENSDKTFFISPRTQYENTSLDGCYLKIESEYESPLVGIEYEEIDGAGSAWKEIDTVIGARELVYNKPCTLNNNNNLININIENSIHLNGLSQQAYEDSILINFSQTNNINFLDLDRPLELLSTKNLYVATIKRCADVYCFLDNLTYTKMHTCPYYNKEGAETKYEVFGGDIFITPIDVSNTLAYKFNDGIADNIVQALSIAAAAAITVLSAGAGSTVAIAAIASGIVGITASAVTAMIQNLKDGRFEDFLQDNQMDYAISQVEGGIDFSDYIAYMNEHLTGIYVDSTINTSLRNFGTGECSSYYQRGEQELITYFRNKIMFYDEAKGAFAPKPILCPEFYEYNRDYSVMPCDSVYFPVSKLFDYCSKCIGQYPNRVIWSPKSFSEDLFDTYSINNANDYKDFPADKGILTDIKYKNGNLLFHTEDTTYITRPNPQSIQLDSTTAYLGTGTFLGVPEQELTQTDIGYAGKQTLLDDINTEHGYTWVDAKAGKVFNFASSLEEISRNKMYHWFKENLPFKLMEANCTDYDLCHFTDNLNTAFTSNEWLVGVYDPVHERYILSKKDYLPLCDRKILDYRTSNDIYFDGEKLYYRDREITLNDTEFFCPCHWTISYSYKYKRWRSWHSYILNSAYYDTKSFYASYSDVYNTDTDTRTYWKHNYGRYQTYGNRKYHHIIEYVANDFPKTTDKHAVHWYSQTMLYNKETDSFIDVDDVTFNKLWVYTRCQSTGIQELLPDNADGYLNIFWDNKCKHVKCVDNNYKVDQLRDLVIDSKLPVYTKICPYDNDCISTDQFTDKVPINIDYNKSMFELGDIKDKYAFVRLYFTNDIEENYKISTHLINTKTFNSIR